MLQLTISFRKVGPNGLYGLHGEPAEGMAPLDVVVAVLSENQGSLLPTPMPALTAQTMPTPTSSKCGGGGGEPGGLHGDHRLEVALNLELRLARLGCHGC